MPSVWPTPSQPPTMPRCRCGTWSGTAAKSAACMALSVNCAAHQPSAMITMFGAPARIPRLTTPPSAPIAVHGSRLPARHVVRSEIAPNNGLAMTEHAAPRPETTPSAISL
jgi:hypothetical protein